MIINIIYMIKILIINILKQKTLINVYKYYDTGKRI